MWMAEAPIFRAGMVIMHVNHINTKYVVTAAIDTFKLRDQTPMTYEEFFRERQDARYGGKGGYWFGKEFDGARAVWTGKRSQVRVGFGDPPWSISHCTQDRALLATNSTAWRSQIPAPAINVSST